MSETVQYPPVSSLHRHPAVKWVLMVALLCTAGLGLPRSVAAAAPSVQAPTGAQSGGTFTGTFTFVYYIYCSTGANYSSSYNSNLEGTNTFAFYGATDGSLLLRINGGGYLLLNSCGDPYTGPSAVASYSVTKDSSGGPAPTPTPTPPPATPTPTPPPGGGSSGGTTGGTTGSTGSGSSGSHAAATPASGTGASDPTQPVAVTTPTPAAGVQATPSSGSGGKHATTSAGGAVSTSEKASSMGSYMRTAAITAGALGLAGLMVAVYLTLPWWRRRLGGLTRSLAWRLEPWWFRLKLKLSVTHGVGELRRRGLSHHKFSGRLMAHHHTSYPALAFLLLVATVLVGAINGSSLAADSTLSLNVSGAAPTTGATITDPSDGDIITSSTITVRGTCGQGLRVEVSRNGQFAGSTLCDNAGLYSLVVTLTPGNNLLTALNFDGADQPGPATTGITATYNPPPPTPTPSPTPTPVATPTSGKSAAKTPKPTTAPKATTPTSPLTLSVNKHYFAGLTTGVSFTWPVAIIGGTSPYQATVDWGDGSQTSLAPSTAQLAPEHTFATAGIYHLTATVTDHAKQTASLSIVAVVSGAGGAAITSGPSRHDTAGGLAWPVLAVVVLITLSFWLGERDRLHRVPPSALPA